MPPPLSGFCRFVHPTNLALFADLCLPTATCGASKASLAVVWKAATLRTLVPFVTARKRVWPLELAPHPQCSNLCTLWSSVNALKPDFLCAFSHFVSAYGGDLRNIQLDFLIIISYSKRCRPALKCRNDTGRVIPVWTGTGHLCQPVSVTDVP